LLSYAVVLHTSTILDKIYPEKCFSPLSHFLNVDIAKRGLHWPALPFLLFFNHLLLKIFTPFEVRQPGPVNFFFENKEVHAIVRNEVPVRRT